MMKSFQFFESNPEQSWLFRMKRERKGIVYLLTIILGGSCLILSIINFVPLMLAIAVSAMVPETKVNTPFLPWFAQLVIILLIMSKPIRSLITSVLNFKQTKSNKIVLCPKCSLPMVRRLAKKGQYAGEYFWGCQSYPTCHGLLSLSE